MTQQQSVDLMAPFDLLKPRIPVDVHCEVVMITQDQSLVAWERSDLVDKPRLGVGGSLHRDVPKMVYVI